jgi:hypothetical protein
MQLVVLAAGHGRRFGGLKQLAPVGRNGESIMDFTAADALQAGFDGIILIVREDVQGELLAHIGKFWPAELGVEPVIQGAIAGTAQAVASARPFVDGPFGVANADDLYGATALTELADHLRSLAGDEHLIVSYRLEDTVLTDAPVTRGVCETGDDGYLVRIVEQSVKRVAPGEFEGAPIVGPDAGRPKPVSGSAAVSMNLWGFSPAVLDDLDDALDAFDPETAPHAEGKPPELLLPDVVAVVVEAGRARVRVVPAGGRCIGITHPDDLPLIRSLVAESTTG